MRHDLTAIPDAMEKRAGGSRLLSRLYHEIGLAAVAFELDVEVTELAPESCEMIRRGARYLNFELLDIAS